MAQNSLKIRNSLSLTPTGVPTSPTNGDIYYDSTANAFQFYQNGNWETISGPAYRAGSQSISSGTTSQAITFSSTLGTTGYAFSATMVNTTDANPQYQPVTITAVSATGFTVQWNAPVDSANYSISFYAILNN